MQKVEIELYGKRALVDEDQVKKHINKQFYVARIAELQHKLQLENNPVCKDLLAESIEELGGRLIRLNRTLRKNVRFI